MTATTNEETLTADAARARLTTQRWFQLIIGIGHAMLQLMHLVFDLLQTAKGRERRFMNRGAFFEVHVLVK